MEGPDQALTFEAGLYRTWVDRSFQLSDHVSPACASELGLRGSAASASAPALKSEHLDLCSLRLPMNSKACKQVSTARMVA